MAKRPSKAEIKRRIAARNVTPAPAPMLPVELEGYLATYESRQVTPATLARLRPVLIDWMRRYGPASVEASRQRIVATIAFLAWADERSYPLGLDLLTPARIEAFARTYDASDITITNYRSKLRGLANRIQPDTAAPAVSVPHEKIKAPYRPREVAEIERFARTQPTGSLRRQVAACVGLGLGAGLASPDLRDLFAGDITDHRDRGLEVRLQNRTVWVRRRYEDLVRTGIDRLPARALVIGQESDRRNIAGAVYARAEHQAKVVHVEQSRLRTTWLLALLEAGLPLGTIMQASGLASARTLTELIPYLDADGDTSLTREVR